MSWVSPTTWWSLVLTLAVIVLAYLLGPAWWPTTMVWTSVAGALTGVFAASDWMNR